MKILRMLSFLVPITVLSFLSAPCINKSQGYSYSKEDLAGKWNSIVTRGGSSVEIKIELKKSGEFKIEKIPADGIPEFTGTWELNGNNFAARISTTDTRQLVLFEGKVDFPNLVIKPYSISREMGQLTEDASAYRFFGF